MGDDAAHCECLLRSADERHQFPAGVLQPPLFDPKMDDAPNYGNTGATIGHELTHGFDDEGRQFDAKGDLKDWWSKSDADEFEKRAKCVSDQYSQYTVIDDIKINGKLTLGEDLADLGGTWLAYLAWKDDTRGQDLQPIDGFAPDQRFFIGMAQWACGDERAANKRMNAITNEHSPDEYRITGLCRTCRSSGKRLLAGWGSRWCMRSLAEFGRGRMRSGNDSVFCFVARRWPAD